MRFSDESATTCLSRISIHRMQGGKIAETWEVWDTLSFMQQIGVVPAS